MSKVRPFSTGSQYAEWTFRNCGSCRKGFNNKKSVFYCDWELALCVAHVTNGEITEKAAKAIGYLDNKDCYIWECPGWRRR